MLFKLLLMFVLMGTAACDSHIRIFARPQTTSLHNGQVLLPGNPSYGDLGVVPR